MNTTRQAVYDASFGQAFNHWLQTRKLIPRGIGPAPQVSAYYVTEEQLVDARLYAKGMAELAVQAASAGQEMNLAPNQDWAEDPHLQQLNRFGETHG